MILYVLGTSTLPMCLNNALTSCLKRARSALCTASCSTNSSKSINKAQHQTYITQPPYSQDHNSSSVEVRFRQTSPEISRITRGRRFLDLILRNFGFEFVETNLAVGKRKGREFWRHNFTVIGDRGTAALLHERE